jgi:hypothetical protein
MYSGDLSGNGYIDLAALKWLAEHWLQWNFRWDIPDADIYPDGHTDFMDFFYLAESWQQCYQPSIPPELMEYYHQNRLVLCSTRLRAIATSIALYSNDNSGDFPPTLQALAAENYFGTPWPDEMFACPAVCPHPQYSDYVYRGTDLDDTASAYMIVLYDRQNNHPAAGEMSRLQMVMCKQCPKAEFLAAIDWTMPSAVQTPGSRKNRSNKKASAFENRRIKEANNAKANISRHSSSVFSVSAFGRHWRPGLRNRRPARSRMTPSSRTPSAPSGRMGSGWIPSSAPLS